MRPRKIIHVDMDCFYAAVEMRDRPALAGRPLAVGGSAEGRGVIATANYEARKFGVRSAMATATALRLCPGLILIHPDMSKYKTDGRKAREIYTRFTPLIEPLSLDEAYLDVTDSPHFGGSATRTAEEIRRLIKEELRLTASAGVAPNKFLAKIACEMNKPDGLAVIKPSQVETFVKTLPVEKIWGVGKVTAARMRKLGIHTCGDLQKYSMDELTGLFGSWGVKLHDFARGIDERPVRVDHERKSLSVEETYASDLATLKDCLDQLPELYSDWSERAARAEIAGHIRGIFVKVKFHDFRSTTHETVFTSFPKPGDFRPLLEAAYLRRAEPVRLIGLGARLAAKSTKGATPQLSLDIDGRS